MCLSIPLYGILKILWLLEDGHGRGFFLFPYMGFEKFINEIENEEREILSIPLYGISLRNRVRLVKC